MKTSGVRSVIAFAIVVVLGLAAFSAVTAGFAAVTSDGVRRVQLKHNPRVLPDLPLIDARGTMFSLRDYGGASDYVTFITLVYLQCQSVCRTSIAGQSWMQHAIQVRGLEGRVRLLTLSFDPANDSPQVMAEHARRMGGDADLWRFATLRDTGDLNRMLALFDIIVLPDGLGGYSHNAGLFLINERGQLARAYDVDRPDLALADYLARAKGKGG